MTQFAGDKLSVQLAGCSTRGRMKRLLLMTLALAGMVLTLRNSQAGALKTDVSESRRGKVVAFYGDSTIRGYKTHSGEQVRVSTPDAFAAALGSDSGYVIVNEGVDSSRVEHLMNGTDGKHPRWDRYIATAPVDIVITNHASKNGNPVDQYESDLRRMVRLARASRKTVILMTPNPIAEGGLEEYVDAMRRVAATENVPLIDVFLYLKNDMRDSGKGIADLVPDGYHPSDATYIQIGKYAAQAFRRMMANEKRAGRRGTHVSSNP